MWDVFERGKNRKFLQKIKIKIEKMTRCVDRSIDRSMTFGGGSNYWTQHLLVVKRRTPKEYRSTYVTKKEEVFF